MRTATPLTSIRHCNNFYYQAVRFLYTVMPLSSTKSQTSFPLTSPHDSALLCKVALLVTLLPQIPLLISISLIWMCRLHDFHAVKLSIMLLKALMSILHIISYAVCVYMHTVGFMLDTVCLLVHIHG